MYRLNSSDRVQAAIHSLPSKQLAAVIMHKYEGMDYEQIAQVLNCSISDLKPILLAAYETLRSRLCQ
jgi:RNA polymerase sigma-70 factor (ECF subfamily)